MFAKPTVFVIGAGASAEYKIAVGDLLKSRISDLLDFDFDGRDLKRGDGQICETLRQYNKNATGQYSLTKEHFASSRLISEAMPHALSIDNFIDAHRGNDDIALCAKLAIVKSILNEEKRSSLSRLKNPYEQFEFISVSNGWISRLFQMITENVSVSEIDYVFQNISLIVFNYDRCIEAYIPRALGQYYGIHLAEAERIFSKLNIIHPYGMVGSLNTAGKLTIPFGSIDVDLLSAASGIKTFSEGLADPAMAKTIEDAFKHVETLVFLGFSFHPLNLEILTHPAPDLQRVFATTFGLSKSAVSNIEQALLQTYNKLDPALVYLEKSDNNSLEEVELENLTAYDFCTQYFRSLSSINLTRSA